MSTDAEGKGTPWQWTDSQAIMSAYQMGNATESDITQHFTKLERDLQAAYAALVVKDAALEACKVGLCAGGAKNPRELEVMQDAFNQAKKALALTPQSAANVIEEQDAAYRAAMSSAEMHATDATRLRAQIEEQAKEIGDWKAAHASELSKRIEADAQLAQLEADNVRLDWLLHHCSYADKLDGGARIYWGLSNADRGVIDAAIDAARTSANEKTEGGTEG